MENERSRLLSLILGRLGLVIIVVASIRLALPSQPQFTGFLLPFFLSVFVLSSVYLLLWKYAHERVDLFSIQLIADLALQSILLYFTGGPNSLFIPFYVVIIVYSSLFRGREGGLLALILSLVSYLSLVLMDSFGYLLGSPVSSASPNQVYQLFVNILAFVSVAFLGIYLSERLQSARRELGAARVLQQNIIDSIRSGLCTVNLKGEITFLNKIGAEILRRPLEDLLGRHFSKVFARGLLSQIREIDFQTTRRALRLETWIEVGTDKVYLGVGCSPLLSDDQQVIGYVMSFQDLTEIKKREDELQFRKRMAAIGEMAAGLAHELRNPLASLSGSIQILKSELDLSEERARLLDIVLRESERLNRIVQDFLTYAGPQPLSTQDIDLPLLVQETVELFRNTPEFESGHHVEVRSGNHSIRCRGNSDQLRQVVWNILQNGIRAMPGGGRLIVEIASLGDHAVMRFRDEGLGMDAADREKLFQPFHSGFRKGSGLGMAIVYQIVHQHSGEIEVVSSPREGTVVEVRIPG